MRERDTRKVLKELRHLCKANGIELAADPSRGKGSHVALIFREIKSGKAVSFVIAGGNTISPGVQRNILKYLTDLATKVAFAEVVRRLLEYLFK